MPPLSKTPFKTAVWAIVKKDLLIELNTRQSISIMVMFSLASIIMFNFALETNLAAARNVATGLLWATILLAGTLGLNRTIGIEQENQAIDTLLIAPIDRHVIYVAKTISTMIFTAVLEIILVFAFTIFFNKPFLQPSILLIIFLGTIGYIGAGVLITSMTIQTRARDILLPVVLLPVTLPLILPVSIATAEFMTGQPEIARVQTAVSIAAAYDIIIISVGLLVYRFVIES
ncbi:MAG: heme exporter protein CcmB [Chloroflexota bacterium]